MAAFVKVQESVFMCFYVFLVKFSHKSSVSFQCFLLIWICGFYLSSLSIVSMIDLLYFWYLNISLMWKEGCRNSERLLHLLKHAQRCNDDVLSAASQWALITVFSVRVVEGGGRGGEEVVGEHSRGGEVDDKEKVKWENGGVGAAIMIEKQYCGNIAGQFCQSLYSHSSWETWWCTVLNTLISLDGLFITVLVPNNTEEM